MKKHVTSATVDREMVIAAYRLFLDRNSENTALVEEWVSCCKSPEELRNGFLHSREFTEQSQEFIMRRVFLAIDR
jgi:hypothetical protein